MNDLRGIEIKTAKHTGLRLYVLRRRFLRQPEKVLIATAVLDESRTPAGYRRFRFPTPPVLAARTSYLIVPDFV